ncbi:MAG: hypothetical protein CL960_01660 [Euryarchaeota archaeon]|nr:hypothetical protein [Euryarchaeota archaeon]MDP6364158.1 hypothetical protein [Candidatus Poseidoniia archaeon]MDP6658728.1 hypothetical protein [Candidatus Poseidoniia archaeon]MDP6846292.1 hypothetical protein [Candidatus Poseidoniia archaeon]MDP7007039.1 hypothetical protein [Candidatus Poseidoniia archaeon]
MGWLDDVDIAILAFVADNPDSSVTDGARELFAPGDVDELRKRDSMLRHRYKVLAEAGLLAATPQGREIPEPHGRELLNQLYQSGVLAAAWQADA